MSRPVVCVTGGDTRTTMALAALEAQLATGPLHAVTHLVCGGLEPSQPPRRTLKLLYALARGARSPGCTSRSAGRRAFLATSWRASCARPAPR